jgi:hypothetical protein
MDDKTGAERQHEEFQAEGQTSDDMRASIFEGIQKFEQRSQRRKAARSHRSINRSDEDQVLRFRLVVRNKLRKINTIVSRDDLTDEAMSLYSEMRELMRDFLEVVRDKNYDGVLAKQLINKIGKNNVRLSELKKDHRVLKKPPLSDDASSEA